ncbi:hypothetical protein JTE90_015589 [Oedothorax gibbosus]|uniref:MD-2-related lipid-recognition domain-containing protein n=1 Tax=Oedothorax gibbosus TaxID=931172 RepID=A0AAV6TZD2_9ARAC|nr:hypothetical protein JTE90_015589 [Oedothorax gibbosus]
MKYIIFVLCIIGLWGSSLGAKKEPVKFFRVINCIKDNSTDISQLEDIELTPDPVIMKRGNLTMSGGARFLRDIPDDTVLKVRFYKLKSVLGINIDIPIPCVLGKFGSCTLPVCKYLEMYKEQVQPFWPEGEEYGCKVKAGPFYGGHNVTVTIPDLGIFGRLLVSGKYRAELEATSKKDEQKTPLLCFKIFVEIR